jgi:hypothetical protein
MDVYEQHGDLRCLEMAAGAGEYLMNELYWTDASGASGFAYPLPSVRTTIHNANLLASAFVSRLATVTGETKYLAAVNQIGRSSVAAQRQDGSWTYGEGATQQWVDSFHTGFNLRALKDLSVHLQRSEYGEALKRGLRFYREHFFRQDGAVRYFHDGTFPIDAHGIADGIITLVSLRHLDASNVILAKRVANWALEHMLDKRGFFHYRRLRFLKIKTSYMRWSQAWMLLALSTLIAASDGHSAS